MNKYINKALNTLNIEWLDDENCTIGVIERKLADEKQSLIDLKYQLQECKDLIVTIKELIPDIEDNISLFNDILHQVNVEEYKELNKDIDCEIF